MEKPEEKETMNGNVPEIQKLQQGSKCVETTWLVVMIAFQFGKTGNKTRATRFATMLQNRSLNFVRLLRIVFSSQQGNNDWK